MSLPFINEEERAWNRLTLSKLPYSIYWNNLTGKVKVVLPNARMPIYSKGKAANANVALGMGEEIISEFNCPISRGEYNAKIPIVVLGKCS